MLCWPTRGGGGHTPYCLEGGITGQGGRKECMIHILAICEHLQDNHRHYSSMDTTFPCPCRFEAQELGCAKQHLEQQLGRQVVAMLGHSKGATDVLLYAGLYSKQV